MTLKPENRIFVALDTTRLDRGLELARALKGLVGVMKIGAEFLLGWGYRGCSENSRGANANFFGPQVS